MTERQHTIPSGQTIARAFHKDYQRFITNLRSLDPIERARWAVEYAAYMAPVNTTGTPLTAEHVLGVWRRAMETQRGGEARHDADR